MSNTTEPQEAVSYLGVEIEGDRDNKPAQKDTRKGGGIDENRRGSHFHDVKKKKKLALCEAKNSKDACKFLCEWMSQGLRFVAARQQEWDVFLFFFFA